MNFFITLKKNNYSNLMNSFPFVNIGNTTYFHTYVPTRFDGLNVPWVKNNICPFYRMNPALPIFPPTTYGASPLVGIPYNPVLGKYGTADLTMKGYNKDNNCQFGYFPSNVNGQGACCDIFGDCGNGDQRI